MNKSAEKKAQIEFNLLLQHSFYLRSALNIAYDRQLQFDKITEHHRSSNKPFSETVLAEIQIQTSKEIGGLRTKIPLDAPQEIEKYHLGPLQIACCMLYALLEKYESLIKKIPLFKDKDVDRYCRKNERFIQSLKHLRNSILHPRYDNLDKQKEFLAKYNDPDQHFISLLIEGENLFKEFLKRIWLKHKEQWRDK